MREKIFITGGCGFIGSHIVEYYNTLGVSVVVYDNLQSGSLNNLLCFNNVEFINGDISDKDKLLKSMSGCTQIYHLAADISVQDSVLNPIKTEMNNTIGTINVLDSMVINNIKNIVFPSSAAVYGNSEECPKKVNMLPDPISPYAISKLSGEYYVKMYVHKYKLNGIVARFFNVFGERQVVGGGYAAAIPLFISKALNNEPVIIYGDGSQTRDFIYVKDLISCIFELIGNYPSGVYNIGYGNPITINNIAKKIIDIIGSKSEIVYEPERIGDVKHSYAYSQVTKNKDIKLIGFDKGIENTIRYFQDKNN